MKRLLTYFVFFSFFSLAFSSEKTFAQREITSTIDEIVVTAQKREENLQDVPASVSAMDAATLEKTFARDLLDVAGVSPNLIIDPILGNGITIFNGTLYNAVRDYYENCTLENSQDCDSAQTYGFPIGDWCVGAVTSMVRLFSNNNRSPVDIGGFNEDISNWDVSSVQFMNFM